MKRFLYFLFIFFLFSIFSYGVNENPFGIVFTIDEQGYLIFLEGADVRLCGTNITTTTNTEGIYTFTEELDFYMDKYILKVTKDNYPTTYTAITPAFLVEEFNSLNGILVLPNSYAPSSGKSHIIVFTYGQEDIIYGASARVYNSNNQRVDNQSNVQYIKVIDNGEEDNGEEQPPKIEFVDAPGDDTVGYIIKDLSPGYYSISAYKDNIELGHRPVITFANSIISCVSTVDGVWYLGSTDFHGELKDEEDNKVQGAQVKTVGPNYYGTTDGNGQFTISSLSYPSIFFFKSSKTGYKDTYRLGVVYDANGEENEFFIIISEAAFNKVVNDLNISPDPNKGYYVGGILDYYGNRIKNVKVKVVDEQGDIIEGIKVYYMDSNREKFDPDLEMTTDSGVFLIPNLDPGQVYYLHFEIIEPNIGLVVLDLGTVFKNGLTFGGLLAGNIEKGNLEVIGFDMDDLLIGKNAQNIVALKFKLKETTNYESVTLEEDTLIITDKGSGDMAKVSAKLILDSNDNGQLDEGDLPLSDVNPDPENRKIIFNPSTENFNIRGEEKTLFVVYNITNATPGETYLATINENSDIRAKGLTSELFVSVEGAPVKGGEIIIMTEGPPDIYVDPDSYNFGKIEVGEESGELTIKVKNIGDQQLIITEQITLSGNTSDFTLIANNVSKQTIINTGEEKTIIVKFNPQSNGIKTLTISIPSNDPDENPYNITLQ
ncbi:MAG: choice-of-anchor D domain-containing protein, partial [Candidatus Omnitrophica bacterium]|nr:choice-of-anchor D domain-containing protein [Candidatus Omnitrophota bacterium]